MSLTTILEKLLSVNIGAYHKCLRFYRSVVIIIDDEKSGRRCYFLTLRETVVGDRRVHTEINMANVDIKYTKVRCLYFTVLRQVFFIARIVIEVVVIFIFVSFVYFAYGRSVVLFEVPISPAGEFIGTPKNIYLTRLY